MAHAQYAGAGISYLYGMPFGKMAESMDPIHGVQLKLNYGFKHSRIEAGLSFSTGRYDRFSEDVDFVFPDGSSITAPMIVSHNLSAIGLSAQYRLVEAGPLQPFLIAGINLAISHTRLQVRDPDRNATGEGPLNLYDEGLHRDLVPTGSLGAGLRADVGQLFRALSRDQLFAEATLLYSAGPAFEHAYSPDESSARAAGSSDPGSGNFEITQGELHSLHIYESSFSMLSFSLGLSWHFLSVGKSGPLTQP
jgi:hypothetical protein